MNNLRTLVLRVVLLFGLAVTLTARTASTIEQWDVFELTLRGPREGNPFVDVRVSVFAFVNLPWENASRPTRMQRTTTATEAASRITPESCSLGVLSLCGLCCPLCP